MSVIMKARSTPMGDVIMNKPFDVLGADLSLSRPAFALVRCEEDGVVILLGKCNVKRKSADRQHGSALSRIYDEIRDWISRADV